MCSRSHERVAIKFLEDATTAGNTGVAALRKASAYNVVVLLQQVNAIQSFNISSFRLKLAPIQTADSIQEDLLCTVPLEELVWRRMSSQFILDRFQRRIKVYGDANTLR